MVTAPASSSSGCWGRPDCACCGTWVTPAPRSTPPHYREPEAPLPPKVRPCSILFFFLLFFAALLVLELYLRLLLQLLLRLLLELELHVVHQLHVVHAVVIVE